MVDFILQYWKLIILVILIIANLIISIFKRPKVLNTIIETINSYVPTAINDAERVFGSNNGSSKLDYALNNVIDYLCFRFNLASKDVARYKSYIVRQIEIVLSTPQRKEKVNG